MPASSLPLSLLVVLFPKLLDANFGPDLANKRLARSSSEALIGNAHQCDRLARLQLAATQRTHALIVKKNEKRVTRSLGKSCGNA